jgi:hypothetical protein
LNESEFEGFLKYIKPCCQIAATTPQHTKPASVWSKRSDSSLINWDLGTLFDHSAPILSDNHPSSLVLTPLVSLSTKMAGKTYIVEHLDDELGPWSELEYVTIAKESHEAGAKFCLSSVSSSLVLPEALKAVPGFTADGKSVETLYSDDKSRVCLLDPSATKELSPQDGEIFDVFLFGGILGKTSYIPCEKDFELTI